jgi:hypothetical protein
VNEMKETASEGGRAWPRFKRVDGSFNFRASF